MRRVIGRREGQGLVGRVRVLIAGNIYEKRALVRRFLEDDGYDVVGEALAAREVVPAVQREQPDAVVIEDELLELGPTGTIARIRAAQPDVKVVVFSPHPPEEPPPDGPDAFLEKGVALSALTALLGRLLTEPIAIDRGRPVAVPEPEPVGAAPEREAAAGAEAGTAHDRSRPDRGRAFVTAAVVTGAVLIIGGVVALAGGGVGPERAANPPRSPAAVTSTPAPTTDQLQQAYGDLDDMIHDLQAGNYVLATVDAEVLLQDRQAAISVGFAVGGLDQEITSRLRAIGGTLPQRVIGSLQGVLGPLFPTLPEPNPPGGGSTVVLGTSGGGTATNGGVTTGGTTTGGGTSGGGTTTGGGTSGGGEETEGGGGGQTIALGPGDGRAWGQSHRPPKNGWHGRRPAHHGKPSWAQGPKG